MLSTDSGRTDSADERLGKVVADYVRAVEQGNEPDRDEIIARHSDLAGELNEFFDHRDRMKDLVDPLRSAAARVLKIRCPHCHHAIELVDETKLSDISCPTCGSSFSLVSEGGEREFPNGLKRIGQFQLLEQVGAGQFGSVWKAHDLTLERTVAVKVPRASQMGKAEAELFVRDARLAAKLKHPNIVPVHEVGRHEETIYIVTEFIEGTSLKEWVRSERLSIAESARLCVTLSRALHHAHELGVVHRDLKPGNVMMDHDGSPYLVDFGLAKRDSDEITMTLDGQILGTPAYMSPEQARGEGHYVDRRADIYSMGVMLFELLTGELPFRGDRQMLVVQIISDDPPSPRRLNNAVPRDLETICLKCLAKSPDKRYPTSAALADDLQRWLGGQPIHARPVGSLEKTWLYCRRRPMISSLMALLVLVVLAAARYSHEVRQQERADGLTKQLLRAEVSAAPAIIDQLGPYRERVLATLNHELEKGERDALSSPNQSDRRLLASLAAFRLFGDEREFQWLYQRMLSAPPEHVVILKNTLAVRRHELVQPLWELATAREAHEKERIRACCALAEYDPQAAAWVDIAPFVVDRLTSASLEELAFWRDAFDPIGDRLAEPLERILRDESQWLPKRNLAAACLAHYLAHQPKSLFTLLMECSEEQFLELYPSLAKHESEFVAMLERELAAPRPDAEATEDLEVFRRRRAVAAIAAWRLGRFDMAATVLRPQPDPGARTRFIHWAAPFGVDPETILAGIRIGQPDVRVALVKTLGGFNPDQLLSASEASVPELLSIYRTAPDPGLHCAIEWLLRKWGYEEPLKAVFAELQQADPREASEQRRWSIDSNGHTMVVVDADQFLMGAPYDVVSRASSPSQQLAIIDRVYAIASKSTTREQFDEFLRSSSGSPRHRANRYSSAPGHPQNQVSWFDAAAYCNWLSEREGIPEDQWCYQPNEAGEYAAGMRVAANFLVRTAYRLPTEAEWEFGCRAGTTTLRPFGDATTFMTHYVWFAQQTMRPVGLLKPNDFGLFDMLGNASQWYQEPSSLPGRSRQPMYRDQHIGSVIRGRKLYGLRGGSFNADQSRMDSADRSLTYRPDHFNHATGFRVARTVVPGAHDLWAKSRLLGQRGQWREAADLMDQAIRRRGDRFRARQYADLYCTLLMLEDRPRVATTAIEMLQRFRNTDDADDAHLVAQCLLADPATELNRDIEQLVDLAVSSNNFMHYRDMGILRYRQKRFAEAQQWLDRAGRSSYLRGKPKTYYLIAMNCQARGDQQGALEAFRTADRYRAQISDAFSEYDYGEKWPEWLLLESLRREAKSVLAISESSDR